MENREAGEVAVCVVSFIAIVLIIGMVFYTIRFTADQYREQKEWHEKCHYEYIDILGGTGTAYNCSMTRGSIVCDGSVQVARFWGVCDK